MASIELPLCKTYHSPHGSYNRSLIFSQDYDKVEIRRFISVAILDDTVRNLATVIADRSRPGNRCDLVPVCFVRLKNTRTAKLDISMIFFHTRKKNQRHVGDNAGSARPTRSIKSSQVIRMPSEPIRSFAHEG